MRLRGHFNGQHVVLDQPVPSELRPNTPVEILTLDARAQALQEMEAFLSDLWARPISTAPVPGRGWTREELYERGGGLVP